MWLMGAMGMALANPLPAPVTCPRGTLLDSAARCIRWTRADLWKRWGGVSVDLGDGRVLLTGGVDTHALLGAWGLGDEVHADAVLVEVDAPWKQAWQSLVHPRALHAGVALPDGRVMLMGGIREWVPAERGRPQPTWEIVDPEPGGVAEHGPLPACRTELGLAVLPSAEVLFGGGHRCDANGSIDEAFWATEVWTLNPSNGTVTPRAALPVALDRPIWMDHPEGAEVLGVDAAGTPHRFRYRAAEDRWRADSAPDARLTARRMAMLDPLQATRWHDGTLVVIESPTRAGSRAWRKRPGTDAWETQTLPRRAGTTTGADPIHALPASAVYEMVVRTSHGWFAYDVDEDLWVRWDPTVPDADPIAATGHRLLMVDDREGSLVACDVRSGQCGIAPPAFDDDEMALTAGLAQPGGLWWALLGEYGQRAYGQLRVYRPRDGWWWPTPAMPPRRGVMFEWVQLQKAADGTLDVRADITHWHSEPPYTAWSVDDHEEAPVWPEPPTELRHAIDDAHELLLAASGEASIVGRDGSATRTIPAPLGMGDAQTPFWARVGPTS